MMKLAFLAVLMTAHVALAADDCGMTADQVKALPQALAGTWDGSFRSGIEMHGGKSQVLPEDKSVPRITLDATGGLLSMTSGGYFPDVTFAPAKDAGDFAVQGEAPLGTAQLLTAEVTKAGLVCDPATLPQFLGKGPAGGGMAITFRIIGLDENSIALVIRGEGAGDSARVLFDLKRVTP